MKLIKTKMLIAIVAFGLSMYAIVTKNYNVTPYAFLLICSIYLMDAVMFFVRNQTKKAYLFLAFAALFGAYAGIIH